MNYIILDLEATCWQGNAMDRNPEIIEIGAYRVNGYREWIDKFQSFVRPVEHDMRNSGRNLINDMFEGRGHRALSWAIRASATTPGFRPSPWRGHCAGAMAQ